MKKVLIVFVVGFVFLGCSAQNADAQSTNDSQRIVGTWTGVYSQSTTFVFTFNADGTYTFSNGSETTNGNYFISSGKLFAILNNRTTEYVSTIDYYLSPNGRVLVIIGPNDSGKSRLWLNKK